MGIADRDYRREKPHLASKHAGRSGPPEPSATSALWNILFFVAIAFLGYKAATWWVRPTGKALPGWPPRFR